MVWASQVLPYQECKHRPALSQFEHEEHLGVCPAVGLGFGRGRQGAVGSRVAAASPAHAAGTLRVSPLLDGAPPELCPALQALPLLGLPGPVGDVAHAALAARRRAAQQPRALALLLRLAGLQADGGGDVVFLLKGCQPLQLLSQLVPGFGRGPQARGAALLPHGAGDEAPADAAVLALKSAHNVVRGEVPEAFGLRLVIPDRVVRFGFVRGLPETLHVEPAPGVPPRNGGEGVLRAPGQGPGAQLVSRQLPTPQVGVGLALADHWHLVAAGGGGAWAHPLPDGQGLQAVLAHAQVREAFASQAGEREVDDGVVGGHAGRGGHAVTVAAAVQLAPDPVIDSGIKVHFCCWRQAARNFY